MHTLERPSTYPKGYAYHHLGTDVLTRAILPIWPLSTQNSRKVKSPKEPEFRNPGHLPTLSTSLLCKSPPSEAPGSCSCYALEQWAPRGPEWAATVSATDSDNSNDKLCSRNTDHVPGPVKGLGRTSLPDTLPSVAHGQQARLKSEDLTPRAPLATVTAQWHPVALRRCERVQRRAGPTKADLLGSDVSRVTHVLRARRTVKATAPEPRVSCPCYQCYPESIEDRDFPQSPQGGRSNRGRGAGSSCVPGR